MRTFLVWRQAVYFSLVFSRLRDTMVGKFLLEVALLLATSASRGRAKKDSAGKVWNASGVKLTFGDRHARARAPVVPPPPSKRNLAGTIEYRIFNTPPGNAKQGARQWLFLETDSRSFILTWRFLYEPIRGHHRRRETRVRNSRTRTLRQKSSHVSFYMCIHIFWPRWIF